MIWFDFHWFSLNLTIKWAIIWVKIWVNFIEFSRNLLSNFIQNCFGKWEKYFIQFLGFYYHIFIDLTPLQQLYFCITFDWILVNFIWFSGSNQGLQVIGHELVKNSYFVMNLSWIWFYLKFNPKWAEYIQFDFNWSQIKFNLFRLSFG